MLVITDNNFYILPYWWVRGDNYRHFSCPIVSKHFDFKDFLPCDMFFLLPLPPWKSLFYPFSKFAPLNHTVFILSFFRQISKYDPPPQMKVYSYSVVSLWYWNKNSNFFSFVWFTQLFKRVYVTKKNLSVTTVEKTRENEFLGKIFIKIMHITVVWSRFLQKIGPGVIFRDSFRPLLAKCSNSRQGPKFGPHWQAWKTCATL